MSCLRFKAGVTLTPDPAGARLLGSIDRVARLFPYDVTITAGSDSHPDHDPHTLGRAFDLRTHGLNADQKAFLLHAILLDLQDGQNDAPLPVSDGLATKTFYGFIEDPGTDNEHIHTQLRKGVSFP